MPGRRYRRRYRRRRAPRRRIRRRYRRRTRKPGSMKITMRRMPSLFPDVALVTFKYSVRARFTLAQDTLTTLTLRLNSLFDLEYALGGGQPMGFDQWGAFYNKYIVYASSVHMTSINHQSAQYEMFIGPDNDPSGPTSFAQASELPYYKYKIMNSAFAPTSRLSHRCAVKVLEGRRIGSEEDYSALFSANPVNEKFWQIGCLQTQSAAQFIVDVRIVMYFKARLFERKTTIDRS